MNFALVTGSNTDAVINISSTSNVGIPGKWAFKVNNATFTGTVLQELFGVYGFSPQTLRSFITLWVVIKYLHHVCACPISTAPDPCLSNPCDQNADCVQIGLSSDFTCICVPPYSGNGTLCTSEFSWK